SSNGAVSQAETPEIERASQVPTTGSGGAIEGFPLPESADCDASGALKLKISFDFKTPHSNLIFSDSRSGHELTRADAYLEARAAQDALVLKVGVRNPIYPYLFSFEFSTRPRASFPLATDYALAQAIGQTNP